MTATKKLVDECSENQNTADTLLTLVAIPTPPKLALKTEVIPYHITLDSVPSAAVKVTASNAR